MKIRRHTSIVLAAAVLSASLLIPALAAPRERVRGEAAWVAGEEKVANAEARAEGKVRTKPTAPEAPRAPRAPRPGAGFGQGFGPGHGPGPEGPGLAGLPGLGMVLRPFWENPRLAEELALSEEQVAALDASLEATKEALEGSEGSVRDALEAVRDEMEKDAPELDTVLALQETANAAISEKSRIALSHAVLVKNTLTAEQEEVLKGHLHGRPGRPGPGGPGAGDGPGQGQGPHSDVIRQVREIIANGGGIAEIEALINDLDVPPQAKERMLERAEQFLSGDRPEPRDAPRRGQR